MNWVDYAILAVILLSVLVGLFRGFLREVLALAVWGVAFWVAWQFADDAAGLLEPWVEVPSARLAVAFVALLVAALLLGSLLSWVVSLLVKSTGLSGTDRLLGVFFGAARAVVLLTAVVLVAGLTPVPQDPWWRESILIPRLQRVAEWASSAMPPEVARYFDYAPESPDDGRAPAPKAGEDRPAAPAAVETEEPQEATPDDPPGAST